MATLACSTTVAAVCADAMAGEKRAASVTADRPSTTPDTRMTAGTVRSSSSTPPRFRMRRSGRVEVVQRRTSPSGRARCNQVKRQSGYLRCPPSTDPRAERWHSRTDERDDYAVKPRVELSGPLPITSENLETTCVYLNGSLPDLGTAGLTISNRRIAPWRGPDSIT